MPIGLNRSYPLISLSWKALLISSLIYECRSFVTYLATSTLDLFNTADYNPDRLTLGVSVRDLNLYGGLILRVNAVS